MTKEQNAHEDALHALAESSHCMDREDAVAYYNQKKQEAMQ